MVGRITGACAAIAIVLVGCDNGSTDAAADSDANEDAETIEEADSDTQLQAVYDDCTTELGSGTFAGRVEDEGYTLVLPGVGQEEPLPDQIGAIDSLECILEGTSASTAVQERISATRALDGMQEASWGSFSAVWTYHPNNGLRLIVEESPNA